MSTICKCGTPIMQPYAEIIPLCDSCVDKEVLEQDVKFYKGNNFILSLLGKRGKVKIVKGES